MRETNIAVVTDSAAMLSRFLVEQHGIFVAPLTIVVDGHEYLDGVNIEAEELYAALRQEATASTSQPSPGQLLACYQQAADAGATAILSIHIGSGISGTLQSSAAAAQAPVPVTLVDTGQASFAEGLCVLEAVDALADGASVDEAAEAARRAGKVVGNTFVVKALGLARRGGRLSAGEDVAGIPVLALQPDGIKVAGQATTLEEAVDLMATHIHAAATVAGAAEKVLRVGIGNGDADAIASELRERVTAMLHVGEVIDYAVGPSMGVHLGPGNAGAVFIARPV